MFAGYLVIVLSVIGLCVGLRLAAPALNLMDIPDQRKQHGAPTALVGGIAIFSVMLIFSLWVNAFSWIVLCGLVLGLIGVVDDAIDLGVRLRLGGQVFVTTLAMLGTDVLVNDLGTYGSVSLSLGVFASAFTLFAVVGVVNAFNMLDGLDGLASGHVLVTLFTLFVASVSFSEPVHSQWLLGFVCAVFGFWLVNMRLTPFPKVFLGDAGSMFLGFVLAWLIIGYTQPPWQLLHPVLALWCLSVPIFDTAAVVARRVKAGRSPFAPDRLHLHHVLVDMGVTVQTAVMCLLLGAVSLNLFGLLIFGLFGPATALAAFSICFCTFVYFVLNPRLERAVFRRLGLINESDY